MLGTGGVLALIILGVKRMFHRIRRVAAIVAAALTTAPALAQLDIGDQLAFRVAPSTFPELNFLYDIGAFPFSCTPPFRVYDNAGFGTLELDLAASGILQTFSQHCVMAVDLIGPDLIVINIDSDGPNSPTVMELTIANIDASVDSVAVESSFSPGTTAVRVDERTIRVSIPLANLPAGDAETAVRLSYSASALLHPTDFANGIIEAYLNLPGVPDQNLWQALFATTPDALASPLPVFVPATTSCPQLFFETPSLEGLQIASTIAGDTIDFTVEITEDYAQPLVPGLVYTLHGIDAPVASAAVVSAPFGVGVAVSNSPHDVQVETSNFAVTPGVAASVRISVRVDFQDPIIFTLQPRSQVVNTGENLALSVAVQPADPSAVVLGRWKRDGVDLADGPSASGGGTVFGSTTPNLLIQSANPADAGIYQYVAFDFVNVAFSDEAVVGVRSTTPACAGDLNNDGQLNFFDIQTYLSIFLAGCP
jgi:hypothetical protein